jgi:hypothetical protein
MLKRSSTDGSYYYSNTNGSTYYNSGEQTNHDPAPIRWCVRLRRDSGDGYAQYTSPSGDSKSYYGADAKK